MNWKTTLILALLAVAGGLAWYWLATRRPAPAESPTLAFLENLKEDKLTAIEIQHGGRRVQLARQPGQEWSLPAGWPIRTVEVSQFLRALTQLRSRYEPIPIEQHDLAAYGMDRDPLRILVTVDGQQHTLTFGERPDEANRFSRATFLRLDQHNEVVRLSPGLIGALDRPQEYFQRPRLFAVRSVPERKDGGAKVEQVEAGEIRVESRESRYALRRVKAPGEGYTLAAAAEHWELTAPVRDRLDADKLRNILTALPDLWAEQYIDARTLKPVRDKVEKHLITLYAGSAGQGSGVRPLLSLLPCLARARPGDVPPSHLAVLGLLAPEHVLTVHGPAGPVKLLIGKSDTRERTATKPGPFPGAPPMPAPVTSEVRYAKLEGNPQVFEIRPDKLKDILVLPNTLRDLRLARFEAGDVRRLEIRQGKTELVFAKEKQDKKDRWRMLKPEQNDADSEQISELLNKLSGLDVKESDIIDPDKAKAAKEYGLDTPAVVFVEVEEGKKDDDKKDAQKPTVRQFTFRLGIKETKDADKKLCVQVDDLPRINVLDESLWKLASRPALAYRPRKLLDFAAGDVAKIEVQRTGESFALEQEKDKWKMTKPVSAEVESFRATNLAHELGRLEAVEFVTDSPKKEDLDKIYGLEKPAALATVTFTDNKKPTKTVRLGREKPDKKEHYYARIDDGPVFLVRKSAVETIDKESLAYRALPLWDIPPGDIAELRVKKGDAEYTLRRDGAGWRIGGPFDAVAVTEKIGSMVEDLAEPRRAQYIAHQADDLKTYGLDKPELRITVVTKTGKDKQDKSLTLEVGKPAPAQKVEPVEKDAKKTSAKEAPTRYARLADDKAIFTISEKLVQAIDHTALDLLDRTLVKLDPKTIIEVRANGAFTLKRDKDDWQVVDSPSKPFVPDEEALQETLGAWSNLRALRFAAYGAKVDWADYGLDKPARAIAVSADGKEHTLSLGKEVPDKPGQRFARLDKQEGVAVLDAAMVRELDRTHLDFVDRRVLKFDLDAVSAIQRKMGKEELEIVKKDDVWHLIKPSPLVADGPTVDSLLEKTFRLRAKRIAAYPAKDLKPFGLDPPEAIVTLKLGASPKQHVVKIGKPAIEPGQKDSGDRYALIDDSTTVIVLADDLARQLVAEALQFRDRSLASFSGADKVVLERGDRRATFIKDGVWKMIEPVKAEAEEADLEEFVRGLSRLRADELVAEKPAERKTFGLDPPQARWRVSSGDKEVLHLLVGNTKDGRCYAQLAGRDLVFLLNPKQTTRVLAEYRSRKIWPPLDAVQIERVTFERAGKPAFTLQKGQNGWRVTGQELKIDDKAVTDTLDALADLKAARYVADQAATLQLYGLAPTPVLAVKIQTSSGERVLHIGRPEGESKRRYATVPGDKSAPVFVISENDARRIVRGVQAFTEEAKTDDKKPSGKAK